MKNSIYIFFILLIFMCFIILSKKNKIETFDNLNKFNESQEKYKLCATRLFNYFNSLDNEWWPTEGTLIGILRYGSIFGKIPSLGEIATDTDIDIMIRVNTEQEWEKLREKLSEDLPKLGFDAKKCEKMKAAYGDKTNIDDKLKCTTKFYLGGYDIHTDIHRYLVNEKENYAYTLNEKKLAYPFQYWHNKIPYKGYMTDKNGKFMKAKFEEVVVPCPFEAADILQNWNSTEYKASDIRYPRGGVHKNNNFGWDEKEIKITDDDKTYFETIWKNLYQEGFISFYHKKPDSRYQKNITENFTDDKKKNLTIVTAYFNIKSKRSKSSYLEYAKYLLSYQGPMVIFIDRENVKFVKEYRKNLPTDIIVTSLEEFLSYKYYGKYNHHLGWYYAEKMHHKMNLDEYSTIINEKINFLKIASDRNKFKTDYFIWFDIGMIRNKKKIPSYFPNQEKLKIMKDKILVFSLNNNICKSKKKPDNNKFYTYDNPPHDVLITGPAIGSHKNNISKLHSLFYNKVESLIQKKKEWAGMEQLTFTYISCENPELFHIEKSKETDFAPDRWFYGIPYFL